MAAELITSAQNPKIKRLLALQKDSSLRRECGLFVVEGRRELQHCIEAGFEIDSLFVCPPLFNDAAVSGAGLEGLLPETVTTRGLVNVRGPQAQRGGRDERNEVLGGSPSDAGVGTAAKVFEVSEAIYDKIAYRGGTEGVIAEVKVKQRRLEDLQLPENPLIVVLEAVEKPGNLGAVLRSADAAEVNAVLICDPLTDLYNPNLIRASIGAIFTVPCVACSSEDAIAFLKAKGISILTAQLQDSSLYYDIDMRRGTAIIMGTESTGLSQQWRDAADAHIRIPMLGRLDSLNVSVSASILMYESVRQRHPESR
jgi:TrmH family RNA methyltransferase